MALQKTKLTSYGIPASYWSVGDIKVNKSGNKYIHLNLHVSKEAKDSGGQIIDNIIFTDIDCNCPIAESVTTLQDALFTSVYEQLKQKAIAEEAKGESGDQVIAFFSDALDV